MPAGTSVESDGRTGDGRTASTTLHECSAPLSHSKRPVVTRSRLVEVSSCRPAEAPRVTGDGSNGSRAPALHASRQLRVEILGISYVVAKRGPGFLPFTSKPPANACVSSARRESVFAAFLRTDRRSGRSSQSEVVSGHDCRPKPSYGIESIERPEAIFSVRSSRFCIRTMRVPRSLAGAISQKVLRLTSMILHICSLLYHRCFASPIFCNGQTSPGSRRCPVWRTSVPRTSTIPELTTPIKRARRFPRRRGRPAYPAVVSSLRNPFFQPVLSGAARWQAVSFWFGIP